MEFCIESLKKCDYCNWPLRKPRRCVCRGAVYCGTVCQLKHWPIHKRSCLIWEARQCLLSLGLPFREVLRLIEEYIWCIRGVLHIEPVIAGDKIWCADLRMFYKMSDVIDSWLKFFDVHKKFLGDLGLSLFSIVPQHSRLWHYLPACLVRFVLTFAYVVRPWASGLVVCFSIILYYIFQHIEQ